MYKIDHEFRLLEKKTDACDEGVVSIAQIDSYTAEKKLFFAVEYKPKVSRDLEDQVPFHIAELFIQPFYLRKRFTHDIWHCLTDLKDFHNFLVETTLAKRKEIQLPSMRPH